MGMLGWLIRRLVSAPFGSSRERSPAVEARVDAPGVRDERQLPHLAPAESDLGAEAPHAVPQPTCLEAPATVRPRTKARRAVYTAEQAAAFVKALRELPPVKEDERRFTTREGIQLLSKGIRALERKGYSLDQIGKALRDAGLNIKTSTLKEYLRQIRKPRRKKPAERAAMATGGV
jgi:hypothetical protein